MITTDKPPAPFTEVDLTEARAIAARLRSGEALPLTDTTRLAALVQQLDAWLTLGGEVPLSWRRL